MSYGTGDSPISNWCGAEDPAQEFDSSVSERRHFQHPEGSSVCVEHLALPTLFSSVVIGGNICNLVKPAIIN